MEADWVLRVQQGDPAAFQQIIDAHREAVFRLAYLMLQHEQDAQDVAQETFLRAYQNLAQFDVTRPIRPWLMRITANLCRNQRRAFGRYWRGVLRLATFSDEAPPSIERQVIQNAEVEAVLDAVRKLSTSEQEIIYLRYFLDFSIEDCAEVLNVAPGTVKSRQHRAIQHLTRIVHSHFPLLVEESLS